MRRLGILRKLLLALVRIGVTCSLMLSCPTAGSSAV